MDFNFNKLSRSNSSDNNVDLFLELIDKLSEEDLDELQQRIASKLMAKDKEHVEIGVFDSSVPLPAFANLDTRINKLEPEKPRYDFHESEMYLELMIASQFKMIEKINTVKNNTVREKVGKDIFPFSIKSNQKDYQVFSPAPSNIQLSITNY